MYFETEKTTDRNPGLPLYYCFFIDIAISTSLSIQRLKYIRGGRGAKIFLIRPFKRGRNPTHFPDTPSF